MNESRFKSNKPLYTSKRICCWLDAKPWPTFCMKFIIKCRPNSIFTNVVFETHYAHSEKRKIKMPAAWSFSSDLRIYSQHAGNIPSLLRIRPQIARRKLKYIAWLAMRIVCSSEPEAGLIVQNNTLMMMQCRSTLTSAKPTTNVLNGLNSEIDSKLIFSFLQKATF